MSVVHSHSHAVIPFGVVKSRKLRAICHMSGFVGVDTPIFEIRDSVGDGSDLLVRNRELGVALATSLGPKAVVLMRGHGVTVVAPNLPEAVYRGVYVDVNARLQLEAMGTRRGQLSHRGGSPRDGRCTIRSGRPRLGSLEDEGRGQAVRARFNW